MNMFTNGGIFLATVPAGIDFFISEVGNVNGPSNRNAVIEGNSFGATVPVQTGEVVFNTGMVGYTEALTDPSYRGQILVLTYPLIGNYGVPTTTITSDGEDEDTVVPELPSYVESSTIHIAGLIVSSYSWQHSHWAAKQSLSEWLQQYNVPAIYNVDTRALTKKLRDYGSILGRIEVVRI